MKNLIIAFMLLFVCSTIHAQKSLKYDRFITPELNKIDELIASGLEKDRFNKEELKIIEKINKSLFKMVEKAQKDGIDNKERYRIKIAQRNVWLALNQMYSSDPENLYEFLSIE